VTFMIMMGETPAPEPEYLKYSTVTGFFLQDEPTTDPVTFDYVCLAPLDLQ